METKTVKYLGVEIEVDYDYSPEEPQTYDYPGYPETVDVWAARVEGTDVTEWLNHMENAFEELGDLILKERKECQGFY